MWRLSTVDCTDAVGLATNIGHFRVLEVNLITGNANLLPFLLSRSDRSRAGSRAGMELTLSCDSLLY